MATEGNPRSTKINNANFVFATKFNKKVFTLRFTK